LCGEVDHTQGVHPACTEWDADAEDKSYQPTPTLFVVGEEGER
jgi:hypothetical protein